MADKNLEKITILLTVRERCDHVNRALDYYSRFPIKVLLMDSSDRPCKLKYRPAGMAVMHLPQMFFTEALIKSLEKVETPYVLIASDDDFFIPGALANAVSFLDSHPDYQCSVGYTGRFKNEGAVDLSDAYTHFPRPDDGSADPAKRLVEYSSHVITSFHGIHRTQPLLDAFRKILPARNLGSQEFCQAATTAILGKTHMLGDLYSVRELIFTAQSALLGKTPERPSWVQIVENPEKFSALLQQSEDLISAFLVERGVGKQEAVRATHQAFEAYKNFNRSCDQLAATNDARAARGEIVSFAQVMARKPANDDWSLIREIVLKHNLSPYVPPVLVDDEGRTIKQWHNSRYMYLARANSYLLARSVYRFGKRLAKQVTGRG